MAGRGSPRGEGSLGERSLSGRRRRSNPQFWLILGPTNREIAQKHGLTIREAVDN